MFKFIKELLFTILIVSFCAFAILDSAQKEEDLVKKHCSGLTGYEYGQCQASIY